MKKKTRLLNLLIIAALFLGACNLPSGNSESAVSTAAAQTLAAVLNATPIFTQTITALPIPVTSTFTPTPIFTNTPIPTATSNCNIMKFETDVTIPDGTIMTPGQAFTKTWRLKNAGTCTWTPSYAIVFSSGNSMNGPATQALTSNVNPGQSVDISVNLTAPASTGEYTAYWKIRDGSGVLFDQFYVQIKVQNPATATNTSAPAFAVTSVTYSVGTFNEPGYVSCPIVTANITTNGAGAVGYHWVRPDGNSTSGTLNFASAGSQSVSEKWYLGSAATPPFWLGIYIDTPNHQNFGNINISPCTSP
jgi:hypothetical protein